MLVYKSVRVCACVYVSVLVLLDKGCAAPENVMLGPTPSGDGLRSAPNTMSLRVYLLRTNAHIRSHFGSSNFSSRAPSLTRAAILVWTAALDRPASVVFVLKHLLFGTVIDVREHGYARHGHCPA